MTTLTHRASAPSRPDVEAPESALDHRARLRLRHRLVLWSLPVILLLLLMATKLVSVVPLGEQSRTAFAAGDATAVERAAGLLGVTNLIEAHKAPFAEGDARALAGDMDGARAAFEVALALAPRDGVEACQIRVNLVLSLEQLGDAAKASSGLSAATPYYDRMQVVVAEAAPGCFRPPAGSTGQELGDARSRAEKKSQQQPRDQPGGQTPPAQPSPDKQQQLDDKTKDNQQQRSQGQNNQDRGSPPQVDKPW